MDVDGGGLLWREVGILVVKELWFFGCCKVFSFGCVREWGDDGDFCFIMWGFGDCDSELVLKGWKDIEGWWFEFLFEWVGGCDEIVWLEIGRECGGLGVVCVGNDGGGEFVFDLSGFIEWSVDIGLVLMCFLLWKVDKFLYVCCRLVKFGCCWWLCRDLIFVVCVVLICCGNEGLKKFLLMFMNCEFSKDFELLMWKV